jgi:hypothetical protein
MRRKLYYDLCDEQDSEYLEAVLKHPSRYMKPCHIAIIRLVLRNRSK